MKIQTSLGTAALAAGLLFGAGSAAAQSPETLDIQQVRAATVKLIQLLVDQGVLNADKAAALVKEVAAPAPAATSAAAGGKPIAGAAPAPVRVPYVPEFVRKEIKDEVRKELVSQAQQEGWAGPGAVPEWVRGLKVEGDLRVRGQFDNFDPDNAPALSVNDTNRNRSLSLLNTTEDRLRMRVRARLGVTATLDEQWSAGIRFTTGSTTDPLSSNQTLGVYNNRFVAAFDRAYVRYRPDEQFNVLLGRFANPWFGTELVWANDLGFDGAAVRWTPKLGPGSAFVTLAALPVQEVELSASDKWLFGAQVGAELPVAADRIGGKLGLAYYHYTKMTGRGNAPGSSQNDYTAPQFTQKGNTYFNISSDAARPLLGLASDYHLLDLTGSVDFPSIGGKRVVLTGDFVKNLGFDRSAVSARVGADVESKTTGWLLKAAFGHPEVAQRGQWQVFAGYRHVERDAVLDAFTDSDFRLGGTDAKGITLGGSYGLGRNAVGTLRYLSADSISGAPLSVDVLQLDLSLRF